MPPSPLPRPLSAPNLGQEPRRTQIFAAPATSTHPQIGLQQPRRTHFFQVTAAGPGDHHVQGQAPALSGEPRRTAVFAPISRPAPEPHCLSKLLREETQLETERARSSGQIMDILSSPLSREPYCSFLSSMLAVYEALETALEKHREHPVVGRLYWPEIFRANALKHDLEYFLAGRQPDDVMQMASVRAWVQRIHHVSAHQPELLIAHAYMRQMRNLVCGPDDGERVGQILRLPTGSPRTPANGLSYFRYPNISDLPAARTSYRQRLDSIPTDLYDEDEILREARRAFAFNWAIVLELT